MKLEKICKTSGLTCEDFGYRGKNKHLPDHLRYAPQHVVYSDTKSRLVYFKPSFDDRFIELNKNEINTIRNWNASIHPTMVFVYNFRMDQYTTFNIDTINERMWQCKREYGNFLFDNHAFTWNRPQQSFKL